MRYRITTFKFPAERITTNKALVPGHNARCHCGQVAFFALNKVLKIYDIAESGDVILIKERPDDEFRFVCKEHKE